MNDYKNYQKYFIHGVVKKIDDHSFRFEFNICIDIDSGKSFITNYGDKQNNVFNEILELPEEMPKLEKEPLDFEVLEPELAHTSTKRPNIETEGQTNDYDRPEAIALSSSSQLEHTKSKFFFPTTTPIVYKDDNIILKIFPRHKLQKYIGLLIYNKLPFYLPFRGLKLTHDGYIKIKLIRFLNNSKGSIRYKNESEYKIPKENLLLVDENDYEESYKDLNFPDFFIISGCQILYDNFTKNRVNNFSLQKNIIINIERMDSGIGNPGSEIYYMKGKILINGKDYQATSCKVTSSSNKIKYLDGTVFREYSFNIPDFII